MSHPANLFVSFSGQDQRDVRKLFASLQAQALDVWDYSKDGQELPLGRPLGGALERRIDGCDYFIAVVSANSTDEVIGRHTHFEVRYAVDSGLAQRGKLIPLLLLNNRPRGWPGAYERLESLTRVEVEPGSHDSVERGCQLLCARMSVAYVPPLLSDPRIFFARRFMRETTEADAVALSNSEFFECMRIMRRCAEKVADHDWAGALREITLFMLYSESKAPGPEGQFYYPQIILGVCQLQRRRYAEAEETFRAAALHPRHDELCFAGLGHTYFAQQRYADALAQFRKAYSINPADKDIEFNMLGTLLETGGEPDGRLLQFDALGLPDEDRFKVEKYKGIALYKQGKYREAARVFAAMSPEQFDDACADYYSSALEECGEYHKAAEVLRAAAVRLGDTNLYHLLARAYLRVRDIENGLRFYEVLGEPGRRRRQYLIEHARVLRAFRPRLASRVRELCETVLSLEAFPDAEMRGEDFFYMGFASYLLGRHEAARQYFNQSCGFCDNYYDDPIYEL